MYNDYIQRLETINSGKGKKYYIKTLGCQLNENDSEKLAGMLLRMGYTATGDIKESDIIVYNTCTVRENAEQKVFGHLGVLKKLKETKKELIIALCGCMMQQKNTTDIIAKKYPHVDIVFGTHNLHAFPGLLYKAVMENKRVYDVCDAESGIIEWLPSERTDKVKAWVTIMYGCNNFCSYCIVPYVRGRERSRSMESVIKEVAGLGEAGFKEVTLLGQNVNSYGKDLKDGTSFAELLKKLNEVPGIERIRFMTSHPKDISEDLIKAMRECKKVSKHLHLPLQSGSTDVLTKMNRHYTKDNYLEIIGKVRENIPDIALTTDIIVGFPGETDADFDETLEVVDKVRFDSAYTFIYSKRKGTPAAENKQQIPDEVKKERFNRLVELQNSISKEINETYFGRTVEVLVEGKSKTNPEFITGRTDDNKIVNFPGDEAQMGRTVTVKIDRVQTWSLEGKMTDSG
ncbi:MAG: tRNA (N6-isopentenyl adenosine(37)-C2)-methylthiotransferase MiaB [Eubacteriales bacterium]|nr:tRNA (N6-isopentenyl adenosine(37)-C2)-methylthiotransferase MiaB [Eubacteriales bacterium]